MWAASECGVRVWDFKDLYEPGIGDLKTGDEYTAPFRESASTSPAMCLVGDEASGVVWSGHRDGRIRCWKMTMLDQNGDRGKRFKEGLSWQAHRGPVLSLVISSCGMSVLCLINRPSERAFIIRNEMIVLEMLNRVRTLTTVVEVINVRAQPTEIVFRFNILEEIGEC